MRVLILGGGVIGITTAYYLAQAGQEVVVIERQAGPAQETSFANAGQISAGYAAPWAAPGVPLKALKWLLQKHAPLSLRLTKDSNQYRWIWQMLTNCTSKRYAINKERMVRLAEYSRDCLDELRTQTGLDYEARQKGTTQLFRTQKQVDSAVKDIQILEQANIPCSLLKPEEIAQVEPALGAAKDKLTGALHLPNDQTGDCRLFTVRLAELASQLGVEFRFGARVNSLQHERGKIIGVKIGDHIEKADAYIVALGSYSPKLLDPLGVYLPIYPLKGYSLTIPITNSSKSPNSTILDETYKIAITRFNNRIRVGGMAELLGYNLSLNPKRFETLQMIAQELYPDSGIADPETFWTGLRPATPDGTPIIGATPWQNLYLNTGHGTLGWTMACGSADLLTRILTGHPQPISTEGFSLARYK